MYLFTDGSVDPETKIGFGGYLATTDLDSSDERSINLQRFENTTPAKLELQTLLWALENLQSREYPVWIYTDSQNIVGLPGRRVRLEASSCHSRRGMPIQNGQLYQKFFKAIDSLDCHLVKVTGHQPKLGKDGVDLLFTLVDRATRNALREHLSRNRFVPRIRRSSFSQP
mgnify:CR=1 FL=1